MLLAIDAGNTRVKWGLHDGKRWIKRGHADTARAATLKSMFARLPPVRGIIVSNVAGDGLRATLERALPASPAVRWIRSAASQCGVRNSYAKAAQLGCDRWAALIGAHPATSPITGERLAGVAYADAAEIERTLAKARSAFMAWRVTPAPRRGELVPGEVDLLEEIALAKVDRHR